MDASKACGPDLVNQRLIREGSDISTGPLSVYFNKSRRNYEFPSSWKLANVTPIYKKSNRTNNFNYRPVSLLGCLGKLTERCVHKHLYNYVVSNNFFSP